MERKPKFLMPEEIEPRKDEATQRIEDNLFIDKYFREHKRIERTQFAITHLFTTFLLLLTLI